jgi:hypothetical protein
MKKAGDAGLKFTDYDITFVKDRKYIFDKMHDGRAGIGTFYRYQPRNITKYCAENAVEIPKIHECAFQRIAQGIFGYAPINIPNTFEVVDHQGKHKKSDAIAKLVGNEIGKLTPPSLMAQATTSIAQRKILYLVFVAFSLITLYWLLREDLANAGFFGALKVLVSPDGLLDKLYSLFWHHKIFVVIGAAIYGCGYMVRKKMEGIFAGFWSKLRADVEKLLVK